MNHDNLLRRLGQAAREQAEGGAQLLDERWNRLAAGTLSAEEEAELRRLTASSAEAGEAYEAFRPLGAEFHARVAAAIAAQAAEPVESPKPAAPQPAAAPVAKPGGRLLPFRNTARNLAVWGAAVGASAAAMVVMLARLAAPLPAYSMADLSGGHRTTRELVGAPLFAPGDRFETVLTPTKGVDRASSLLTEACVQRGDELRPLAVKSEIDTSGAVRVSGTFDRELPPGNWTLWLIVGRKGTLPDLAAVQTFASTAPVRRRHWVALPKPLLIQPRAPD